jgi:Flp pilus assembly protein TadD
MFSMNGNRNGHGSQWSAGHGGLIDELHDFFLDVGLKAERGGALSLALELYEEAVRRKPDSALAWYNFGDALLALGRLEDAIFALRKAVELSPKTALFHYDLGLALYQLGQLDEAAQEFEPIVAGDPELRRASSDLVPSAMTNLALCQLALGDPERAAATLGPARGRSVGVLYNLAMLNYRAKRLSVALPLARAAALVSPDSEDIIHLLGCILMDSQSDAEASEVLHRATRLNPDCPYAWYDLGVTLARLNQREKARRSFQKARRLAPNYFWVYYGLACLDALERKSAKAFANLDLAVMHGFRDVAWLQRDKDLKRLHRDSRWKNLVKALKGNSS